MEYPIILIDNSDTPHPCKRVNFGIEFRKRILKGLFSGAINGNLPRGTWSRVEKQFHFHRTTVKPIWEIHVRGETINNQRNLSVKGRNGNLKQKIEKDLPEIEFEKRSSICSLTYHLKIPRSTSHYAVSKGMIKCNNNHVKPPLRKDQKISRTQFAIDHIDLANS